MNQPAAILTDELQKNETPLMWEDLSLFSARKAISYVYIIWKADVELDAFCSHLISPF